jgi:hypothetical protein
MNLFDLPCLFQEKSVCEDALSRLPHPALLCGSSTLFLIPAAFSWYIGRPILAVLLVITTAISILFWHDPRPSWRRNLDHVWATGMFWSYLALAAYRADTFEVLVVGVTSVVVAMASFVLSCRCGPHWYWYHVLFHVALTVCMFVSVGGDVLGRKFAAFLDAGATSPLDPIHLFRAAP